MLLDEYEGSKIMTHKQNICPRCGGNLFLERDEYEQYLYCLQCGFRTELEGVSRVDYRGNEGRWEMLSIPK
jgi:ribosomal protein S27AE